MYMPVSLYNRDYLKYSTEITSTTEDIKAEDIKTKSVVTKAFHWLSKNKAEVTLILASLAGICVVIPLTAAGILLFPQVLPILVVASCIGIFSVLSLIRTRLKEIKSKKDK